VLQAIPAAEQNKRGGEAFPEGQDRRRFTMGERR
jgi:hypothetical protein